MPVLRHVAARMLRSLRAVRARYKARYSSSCLMQELKPHRIRDHCDESTTGEVGTQTAGISPSNCSLHNFAESFFGGWLPMVCQIDQEASRGLWADW